MKQSFAKIGQFLVQHFWASLGIMLLVKLALAAIFPITADEAYFWQWGRHLALTYYDHSMMAGLWVHMGQFLGDHIFFQRLIAILAFLMVVAVIYRLILRWTQDDVKAKLISLAFFISPVQFLFFMITTDSPLFFFAFLAGVSFAYGFHREKWVGFLGAGVFLGLSLFSKYLILFLALSMGVSLLWVRNKKRIPLYTLSLLAGILPFVGLHFWLAQQNCWWPLQFNVFNRSEGKTAELGNVLSFLFQQVFLLTPWILWGLVKERTALKSQLLRDYQPYWLLFVWGLIFLAGLSLYETGLHWGLSLYPMIYLSLVALSRERLERILAYSTLWMGFLTIAVVVLLALVPKIYVGGRYYADYVMGVHGDDVHASLVKIGRGLKDPVFGTLGYTTSGLMDYHSGLHYIVFKDIDTNGRNDDQWTDYRELNGRDFLLISTYKFRPEEVEEYQKYFDSVEYLDLEVRQGQFYLALGRGFKYQAYRDGYLSWANQQFYQFRPFLPSGQCFFHSKYFSENP